MKKYKHNKTGDIATLNTEQGYKLNKSTIGLIPKEYIENSSDWEEVIEKDYEILSFKENNKPFNRIWKADTQLKDMFCLVDGKSPFYDSDNLIKLGLNIHSVKRLSDGEIFTVGDKVAHHAEYVKGEFSTRNYILEKIYFLEENRLAFYVGKGLNLGIKSLLKPKNPLFKSFDGVDIFKNDEVYFVNKIGDVFHTNHLKIKKYQSHLLYFSTKEKAEEYIVMNKPCLSINDIKKHLKDYKEYLYVTKFLKDLAQKR